MTAKTSGTELDASTGRSEIPMRPGGRLAGYQTWTRLLFVHWRIPAAEIRPLIPDCLELDLFEGDAWLGLVPFEMSGVRPWWFPAVPGISAFPETNVRTYVRYRDGKTGVWFLSLDAQCRPAVEVARWRWHLPYFWSRMSVAQNSEHVAYQSTRKDRRCQTEAEVEIEASLGEVIRSDSRHAPEKPPETDRSSELDRFLADRYALYSTDNYGTLYSGDVYHSLYPLRSADLIQCRQSLSAAAGVPLNRPPDHVVFSEGVTVDIFPLTPVQT